jgi:hypothetical protein
VAAADGDQDRSSVTTGRKPIDLGGRPRNVAEDVPFLQVHRNGLFAIGGPWSGQIKSS